MTPTGISMTAPPVPGMPSAAKWVSGGEPDGGQAAVRPGGPGTRPPGRPGADTQPARPPQATGAPAGPAAPGLLTGAHPQVPPYGTPASPPRPAPAHDGETPDAGGSARPPAVVAQDGGRAPAKRRRGLPGPARIAVLGVAAVVLGTATVGVQMWDRAQWVAERYPAEDVRDVRAGEPVTRSGIRWSVEVTRVPRPNQKPGRVMLEVTVELTPEERQAIEDFVQPTIELRDTTGRSWVTIVPPGGSVYRGDLKVGETARLTAYGVVPKELEKTAKVALVYSRESGSDVLLFSR